MDHISEKSKVCVVRKGLAKANTGDLVRVTRRVRQSSYEAEYATRYTVDLLADGFSVLAKANGKPTGDERG